VTDNFALYSIKRHGRLEEMLRELHPECRLTAARNSELEIEGLELKWPDLSVDLRIMPREEIEDHLDGLAGYISRIYGGEPDQRGSRIVDFVLDVRMVIGITAEPGRDSQGRVERTISCLCDDLEPIVFHLKDLLDPGGRALLRANGSYDPDSDLEFLDRARLASSAAMERRVRSEAVLAAENVPFFANLPPIEDEDEVRRRRTEEVAGRALALWVVASKALGMEQETVLDRMSRYLLDEDLSPSEMAFAKDAAPPQQDLINFSWRSECCWVMLWALGYVRELGRPDSQCNMWEIDETIDARSREEFLAGARPRPLGQLLDEADLIYRYHWATVDARINDREPPGRLDPGVTYERHYALNWLIGYMNQEWDDVTTDT